MATAGLLPCRAEGPAWVDKLTIWATPELKTLIGEREELAEELETLPFPAGANSGIRRGFHTGRVREGEDPWVELTLASPSEADSVVLVAMLGKGARGAVPGYGFPSRFQLEAKDEDGQVHLLMDETAHDFPNPGIYPLKAACPEGVRIASIRLTATEPWREGGPEALALAEMMVLAGTRNVAQGGSVSASSSREMRPTWSSGNLIDMTTPLGLPVAPRSEVSVGWRSAGTKERTDEKLVVVDLGKAFNLDEIQLAPVWKPGVPGSFNLGFPSRYGVVITEDETFKEQELVFDGTTKNLDLPGQNLQCILLDGQPVRYISVVGTRLRESAGEYLFALGEIRAYEGGRQVALGAKVISRDSIEGDGWSKEALTDGLAGDGRLLELAEWVDGLERRRVVENRLAAIDVRKSLLLDQGQQFLIHGSIGTIICMMFAGGVISWRGKRKQRINRERQRERLARDLHDELGSNLGSIALISSFALEGGTDEEQMRGDLAEIELVARESADSMRDLVELLGGRHRGAENDWLPVLQEMAERVVRGVELECRLDDESWVVQPDLETRREIYLFCKEALHNACRHSGASKVRFLIEPNDSGLRVEISDDGKGFDTSAVSQGYGLINLRERAADVHATMELVSSAGKGTVVTLDVPRGRRWRKHKTKKQ